MSRPNILFIMTDQCRADALGCSGGWARTPALDSIADEGVRFANAVTTSPVCIPARVSLALGQYPHSTHLWHNLRYTMPAAAPNWMRALRELGYRTSLFGKTHLHPHGGDLREREDLMHAYGLDDVDEIGGPRASARVLSHMTARWQEQGLWEAYQEDYRDRFANDPTTTRPSVLPLEEYADVYVGQRAKEYLASYDREEPWFCWVSFGGPHEPWDTPEPFAGLHDPAEMPDPLPRPEQRRENRPHGVLDRMFDERSSDALTPERVAAMRANYAGNMALIDDQVGQILELLRERGELEKTVIAFSSDHGELNGDHGLAYKGNFLDGCLRVPLLVRTPDTAAGPQAGSVCDSPAEWLDLGPTLVELAGGALEYEQFGVSLCPVLDDPEAEHRSEALSEISGEAMILTPEWKCAVNRQGEVYLLFDVQNDPGEQRNLAGEAEMREIEDALRGRLLERLMESQSRVPWPGTQE
jgi:choline-sulfatase